MTVNDFVRECFLREPRWHWDQHLSICLTGLNRLHPLLLWLPPLLVLDVTESLLLHKTLLHLVMLEVLLSQLRELSGGKNFESHTKSSSKLLDVIPVGVDQHPQVLPSETKVLNIKGRGWGGQRLDRIQMCNQNSSPSYQGEWELHRCSDFSFVVWVDWKRLKSWDLFSAHRLIAFTSLFFTSFSCFLLPTETSLSKASTTLLVQSSPQPSTGCPAVPG